MHPYLSQPAIFKRMQEALANPIKILESAKSDQSAVSALKNQPDKTDPSLALLDAWAVALHVVAFYQERYTDENYLLTATEDFSTRELTYLTGYHPAPGLGASTHLAFTLAAGADVPEQLLIKQGLQVQSIPQEDQLPQVFETADDFIARPAWNHLIPRIFQPEIQKISPVLKLVDPKKVSLRLQGDQMSLQAGDKILIAGKHNRQDIILLFTVEKTVFELPEITVVHGQVSETEKDKEVSDLQIFALRKRAASFGNNALPFATLNKEQQNYYENKDWDKTPPSPFVTSTNKPLPGGFDLFLDQVLPNLLAGSWLALTTNNFYKIYKVEAAQTIAAADYALSGPATAVKLIPKPGLKKGKDKEFTFRTTQIWTVSEKIELYAEWEEKTEAAEKKNCIHGNIIILEAIDQNLNYDHELIIAQQNKIHDETIIVQKITSPQPKEFIIHLENKIVYRYENDSLLIATPQIPGLKKVILRESESEHALHLFHEKGELGLEKGDRLTLTGKLVPQSEAFILESSYPDISGHTHLKLKKPLKHRYPANQSIIYGNVIVATHGESVEEILGRGNNEQPNQQFKLHRKPLTYLPAANLKGFANTLEIRVNEVLWKEIDNFYFAGPNSRCYTLSHTDQGDTIVHFGDGIHGARLPTGEENVKAYYRVGLGLSGEIAMGDLSLLKARPLGVDDVTNPMPTIGAASPDHRDSIKEKATLPTFTLNRLVSALDFEHFLRGYPGIAKAKVNIFKNDPCIYLTVALEGKSPQLDPTAAYYKNMLVTLKKISLRGSKVVIASYIHRAFPIHASLLIHPDHLQEVVFKAAQQKMLEVFGFAARQLEQPVTLSEIIHELHQVSGVITAEITQPKSDLYANKSSLINGDFRPDELLVVNPNDIIFERMD